MLGEVEALWDSVAITILCGGIPDSSGSRVDIAKGVRFDAEGSVRQVGPHGLNQQTRVLQPVNMPHAVNQ
jgi:hypothetical protein